MGTAEFLDGVVAHVRAALPPAWADFEARRQGHLIKLWYREPRLHYEVWPVAGRELVEVGLHFEADATVNRRLLDWFDPHMIALKAALDGAIELEQWTASWGHLYHVYPAPALTVPLQAVVGDWLARAIPLVEPLLRAALADLGPVGETKREARDWAEWRRRRARRAMGGA
jgi:hypothetical protein